jgi:hypothetical protein
MGVWWEGDIANCEVLLEIFFSTLFFYSPTFHDITRLGLYEAIIPWFDAKFYPMAMFNPQIANDCLKIHIAR